MLLLELMRGIICEAAAPSSQQLYGVLRMIEKETFSNF
jgi:hypothetical protein